MRLSSLLLLAGAVAVLFLIGGIAMLYLCYYQEMTKSTTPLKNVLDSLGILVPE